MTNKYLQFSYWGLLVVVTMMAFVVPYFAKGNKKQTNTNPDAYTSAAVSAGKHGKKQKPTKAPMDNRAKLASSAYSFLQGPKSWKKKLPWSGAWSKKEYRGNKFGAFGCGLCCIANIYGTLTDFEASPIDAYQFSVKNSGYEGGGAIAWEYMEHSLREMGFGTELKKMPKDYSVFQKKMAKSRCAIVLVTSNTENSFWKDTPGHYVTIFFYDQVKDEVLLADSGNPPNNRQWVSLRKIYDSLKDSSDYQYLRVINYDASKDKWQHKGTTGKWIKPE